MKKALLVISFGSTVPAARKAIARLEAHFQKKYQSRDTFSVYTSGFIRRKLKEKGEVLLSPEEMLNYLQQEGYEDVVICPTMVTPGIEYDKLKALVEARINDFLFLYLDKPLINDNQDLLKIADALMKAYPLEEGEGMLLFGHGTDHLANFIYPALQTALRCRGLSRAYVATVDGWPSLADAMGEMERDGIRKVFLFPFLLIAGKHVLKDMLGDGEESWINQLKGNGFQVRYSDQGLCALEEVIDLYLD